MKKITFAIIMTFTFTGSIYANECLESLNKYNEYSDLSKDATDNKIKLKHESASMDYLKKVSIYCDHLKEEEREDIEQVLEDYKKK
ncbi:hypothetical protein HUE87_06965 [Candidatus Sulfurimonas marisnigri]|uniref:Uncharacterized protein n=1 Tax=Candidatus Sulfurimonas marisnigri TaxID=2740405 RepID=A0A7S7LY94_9BACT|nr:hypothetical protein [Candidatus Sulfurimonas marisnigri]QOY53656.1 hypothetical protein HUE87_06965 [Candidatus Sulfurimonas marisnigri]